MILARELAERSFDLIAACIPVKAKDFVVIAVAHVSREERAENERLVYFSLFSTL
jgi:hypothetical protein